MIRAALARRQASIRINSSMMLRFTGGPGRLDDEDVAAADVLVQLDADLAVREIADLDGGQLDAEVIGDLLGQIGMSPAADDREMIVRHPCELASSTEEGPAARSATH